MELTRPERAAALARRVAQGYGDVSSTRRFPTGLCHYVFDVTLCSGAQLVVRVADPQNRHLLEGAVAWARLLRPLGVPLPALLDQDTGDRTPLPYLVLERLPGDDLGVVYEALSPDERRSVAGGVAQIQRAVASLGVRDGYGYSHDPTRPPPRAAWADVVRDNLRRSGYRLRHSPPARELHRRVTDRVAVLQNYLEAVAATPFLDDLTTKNVIVHGGRLSGVVDVDVVCFGDPLYPPALTKVALTAAAAPLGYVEAWLEQLAPDGPAAEAFGLYCAVFCLDLLSEAGLAFNRAAPVVVEQERVERLIALATGVLAT